MVDKLWKFPVGSIFYRINDKGRCEKIEKIEDVDFNHCDYAVKFRMENGEEETFYYDYNDDDDNEEFEVYITPKEAITDTICKLIGKIEYLECKIEKYDKDLKDYKERITLLNQQRKLLDR